MGTFTSCYFSLSNGVKQGEGLSPILFTLYIDKLLIKLKHAHIGRHINNIFTGALSYPDDIILFCPSMCDINPFVLSHVILRYTFKYRCHFLT